MRVLAIDYGDARTGIAVSDETGTITADAFTVEERDPKRLAITIGAICVARKIQQAVLGYPRNMNGGEGPRAQKTRDFQKLLAKAGVPVVLWDERQTTKQARRMLIDSGAKQKTRRDSIDAAAASLILEAYLGTL